jgi:hypothetical protein
MEILVSDHRVIPFLGAACLPAACLRATHRQAPRLAQAGRNRFDLAGFGAGVLSPGAKFRATEGGGKVPRRPNPLENQAPKT